MDPMTLAQLASMGSDGPGPQNGLIDNGNAYREYVINCVSQGKQPLSMQDWIKAGRPNA